MRQKTKKPPRKAAVARAQARNSGHNGASSAAAATAASSEAPVMGPAEKELLRGLENTLKVAKLHFAEAVLDGMGAGAVKGAIAEVDECTRQLGSTVLGIMRVHNVDPNDPHKKWHLNLTTMEFTLRE